MNLNNRWFQLGASLVAMVMIANLQYAWTLFVAPLQKGTGWKLSDIQFAFTLFILFQTWVQPCDGWLIDKLGPRGFVTAAGLMCGVGWAGMGYASSLPMFYALYCLAGAGAAFVYSGAVGSALKWFRERRGLASGIMTAGFGGGTALFIPFIQSSISNSGYRATFVTTGILQGIVIAVMAQFLRHPPSAPSPLTGTRTATGADEKTQFTTIEVLRTSQFYVLYVAFVLMATGGLLVTANAGPMARSWGFSITLAATLSPLANGTARIFWGWASDRLGRENTMIVTFVLQAICLVAAATLGHASATWFVVTLVAVYFTWGQIYSLFPSMSGDYFGVRHATSNYAVLYTAKGVASIIGGYVAARLYERTGSWAMGFYGSAVMALIAAGLAYGLRNAMSTARAKAKIPLTA
jgi:MFS transporter, OFA family, oxalate/formate antiporter